MQRDEIVAHAAIVRREITLAMIWVIASSGWLCGLERWRARGPACAPECKAAAKVEEALRAVPPIYGLPAQLWDGPLLSTFLEKEFGAILRVRQCQRLFRQLDPFARHDQKWAKQASQRRPQ